LNRFAEKDKPKTADTGEEPLQSRVLPNIGCKTSGNCADSSTPLAWSK
jgi:hypothetical protein